MRWDTPRVGRMCAQASPRPLLEPVMRTVLPLREGEGFLLGERIPLDMLWNMEAVYGGRDMDAMVSVRYNISVGKIW